jgi:hypothetical protein
MAGLLAAAILPAQSTLYYVDSVNGDDANAGTQSAPWKTLSKANGTVFQAGDKLLFKAGCTWVGQLNPKGSGTASSPIVVDQYGSGPKPIINGNGSLGYGAVYLVNQEHWEINNLEITNDAAEGGDRRGIYLGASNYAGTVVNQIHVRNCYIHNIKGIVDQTSSAAKRTGGIIVEVIDDTPTPTRFNDILIENCVISTVDNQGIALNNKNSVGDYPGTPEWEARKFTHVVIRGNRINDVAKNAMIIRLTDETGLIERNVCWDTAYRAYTGNTIFSRSCRGTVFQYNEGYQNRAGERDPAKNFDGSLYDADLQSPGCIFQYSYSHDNAHGLYWQCTDAADTNVIVRYNISQNDKGIIFCMNYEATSTYVYNNTVFIGPGVSPTIIDERRNAAKTYYFYNNVFYNLSPTAGYQWFNGNRTFDGNLFFGFHPAGEPDDGRKLTSDPRLVNPGSGGTGLHTLAGYKLQVGSPCIDSGITVPNHGGRDFWTNVVPFASATDRGAHEWFRPSTNAPAAHRATVRDGASATVNLDEQALGYVMVKFNTNGYSAKGYFEFDLGGLNPDVNSPAAFRVVSASNSGAQQVRLWALDQAYPDMSDDITWTTAQANELTGNGLLTGGPFTATSLGERALSDGAETNTLTVPAPWGRFVHSNRLVLVLTGINDPTNQPAGFRIVVTNAAQIPTLSFAGTPSVVSPRLTGCRLVEGEGFRFTFTSAAGANFNVLSTTNLAAPLSQWELRGSATEVSVGQYEFTDLEATADWQRFYIVRAS